MIYQAEVEEDNSTAGKKYFVGLASKSFKVRYTNHKSDINNRERAGTELSDHILRIKEINSTFRIKWSILAHEMNYNNETEKCNLCTSEKLHKFDIDKKSSLNIRSDIFNVYIHRGRNMLGSHKVKKKM